MKQISNSAIIIELEKLVTKKKGKINPSEAALATGYSLDDINTGFTRLLELYESKVTMDVQSGAVSYIFAYPLRQRGKKSFKEIMTSVGKSAYKVFKKVYKISIGVILIAYTVLFALILIGIMIASSSNRDSNNSKGMNFDFIASIFLGIIRGMQVAHITSSMVEYSQDPTGMRYRKVKGAEKDKKSFIASVYDFVFGPERVEFCPLSDAREVIAYLKKISNGKLTAGSIILLAGGDYEQAESKLAEYSGKFGGELNVTNDGTLLAEFHNLQEVEKSWLDGKIIYYFDEAEAPYVMNGNSTGKNIGIAAMNLFNLFFSIILMSVFIDEFWLMFALGGFPLLFSILFFLVPLFRYFYNRKMNKQREKNILRKKLLRGIIKNINRSSTLEELFESSSIADSEKKMSEQILSEILIDYQGEISIGDRGEPLYSFPRFSRELKISFN